MPRRTDIDSILLIGSGPIVIGQACEFDYSGTQALKALKEEGFRVILVNSNPATIMTDPDFADRTYIEPLDAGIITKIIEAERPDALLPTLGGQTALNLAIELAETGVLERFGVEMIGARLEAIKKAEDRDRFKEAMGRVGLDLPRSGYAHTLEEALAVRRELASLPLIIRPSRTLGGSGANIAYTEDEFVEMAQWGLRLSPGARDPGGGVDTGLEGVRAGGDARPQGQCGHRVPHRELRPHGGAHRRLHHRGAGPDPDGQGIPGDA